MSKTRGPMAPCERSRPPVITYLLLAPLLAAGLASCGGSNSGGSAAAPPANAAVSVTVQPTSVTAGQSSTLTWSNTGGLSNCTASGGWTGAQNGSGMQTVTPTTTTTYTLTCSFTSGGGSYGGGTTTSYSGNATLTVTGAPPPATSSFTTKLLVSNSAIGTATVDTHLVNPWGLVFAKGAPVWIANNDDGGGSSTLYDGNGAIQGPLVVTFGTAGGAAFNPTGIVFNASTQDFMVTPTGGTTPQAASFLYDGEDGMIAGWPTGQSPVAVVTHVTNDGAVYKGLAIASNGGSLFLYATDFHNNKVEVYDTHFALQTPSSSQFTFTDPTLPSGYSAFGIQAITGSDGTTQIYVTYAPSNDGHDNGVGKGMGLVDVYDTNGQLLKHLIAVDTTNGKLNAPWGLAVAPPTGFGTFSGKLLVSNFGDGTINAYDPATGAFVGTLSDSTGAPIALEGLWGIAFGNDTMNQPSTTLFYTAGPNAEHGGAYGSIVLNQ
jgi:uncharacterized protein (TIGR03118 family)